MTVRTRWVDYKDKEFDPYALTRPTAALYVR